MNAEHKALLDKFYREKDDVERIILWDQIVQQGVDYLEHFQEVCCFCNKIVSIRHAQQVVLYEPTVSYKRQNQWPGSIEFRCNDCKNKKRKLAEEIKSLQRESVRCLGENGFIEDFERYEIYLNLITAKRTKQKMMDRTDRGLVLSHLDNITDFTTAYSDEKAKAEIVKDDILGFLARNWWRPRK